VKQHGLTSFALADPVNDLLLLKRARDFAFALVEKSFYGKEYLVLRREVAEEYADRFRLGKIA